MHARLLSLHFRRAMLAAFAAPTLAACGSNIDNTDAGNDSGLDSPLETTGMDVYVPPPGCTAVDADAGAVACGGKSLELSGDIAACDVTSDSGSVPVASCQSICGGAQFQLCVFDSATSILTCEGMCTGRMPAALRHPSVSRMSNTVGAYLARAAYLEAASVAAFSILATELRAHGAPRSLRVAARRAEADEVRHARTIGALARSHGVIAPRPRIAARTVRALVDVAIENAVEGCVRETFGALVASWQADHATDVRVRRAMTQIARDETRHAALGWRIFAWARQQLSSRDRMRVDEKMERAVEDIAVATLQHVDDDVRRLLGVPTHVEASALFAALRAELWSAAT